MLGAALTLILACTIPIARAQSAPQSPVPVAAIAPDSTLPHGEIQYLWPNGAPGAVGTEEQDKPHLEIFSGFGHAPHTAVIVCPGGGYTHLAYENEGIRIAEWLNLRGITAFVLTYRLAPRYRYPEPVLDAYRSVRWVRAHAAEYHIDADRIGMWGFSAGGHLVGMVGTRFDDGNPQAADPIDRVSDRPDFVISSYGALSKQPGVSRPGALSALIGDNPSQDLKNEVSPDLHVTSHTPPVFLFATTNDQSVPVLTAVSFYTALVKAGVSAEMHIFEQGPHGTGLGQSYFELEDWPHLLENWLRLNGWISYPTPPPSH